MRENSNSKPWLPTQSCDTLRKKKDDTTNANESCNLNKRIRHKLVV